MPAGPGEALLSTTFADIHYYFGDPSTRPQHHRFDRGSYVYLYHNAAEQQAKFEVANHAGTPNQDAFNGYLSGCSLTYSHLQPTLFTLTLNPAAIPDQTTWHLPSYNERNEQKYLYKLHTLDIYMWTEKDAGTFLGHLKNVLGSNQLDIKNAPAVSSLVEHRDSMSPVVQQLEKTAIGNPYQARAGSTVSAQSLPGPPTPAASGGGSPNQAPFAYNPAAPAAPEPTTYRERTPPPPDDGTGIGLGNAARHDIVPQPQFARGPGAYPNSNQTTPQHAYFAGPLQHHSYSNSLSSTPGLSSNVPTPMQQQRTPSFGPMAQSTLPQSPPPNQQSFQRQQSFPSQPETQYANYSTQTQFANYPGTPGFNPLLPPTPSAPPAYSAASIQSPGLPPPPPQPPQQSQQPPIGGYSDYSYGTAQASQSGNLNTYGAYTGDVHSQVYRPTEGEAGAHSKPKRADTDGAPTKITDSFGRMEGKVSKYLNKLDKMW